MSATLRIDEQYNRSGYSVVLREQEKTQSGYSSSPTTLHSDMKAETSEVADVFYLPAARKSQHLRWLVVRAGGGLTSNEIADQLGIELRDVDQMRQTNRLLAVPNPDAEGWVYPKFQLDQGQIVSGLDSVMAEFTVKSPWTRLYVLISSEPALGGRSPIDALKDGDVGMVRRIVRDYGQQGAA